MSSARAALLGAVLITAAALRLLGLSWGLRHPPHWDERVFVENVGQMIESGDLDHRYYEYPALFFYILRPLLALAPMDPPGARAYLLARGVVAAFGVISCALLYRLGVEVAGSRAGLLAALLLAVSPLAVHTAHMVRPDVALQAFALLALLALRRVGESVRGDLGAGAAVGLAISVKFSGAFLLPSYLAQRWTAAGPRLRGTFLAAGAGLAAFVATTKTSVARIAAVAGFMGNKVMTIPPRGQHWPAFARIAASIVVLLKKHFGQ